MDQTQAYCIALLNQEKSLEELQKHLHKTEVPSQRSVPTSASTQKLFAP